MIRAAIAVVAVTAVVGAPALARATEREHHLGVDLGMSALKVDDKSSISACCGLGVHYAYGITDAFNLMAEANGSIVSFGESKGADVPHTRPTTVGHAGVGAGYVFDILTYVPYAGVLVGPTVLAGGTLDSSIVLGDAEIVLGCDYKLSHSWSLGLALEQHMLFAKTSTYPSYTNFFARVEYVWGF
jgi:hypothetical protein